MKQDRLRRPFFIILGMAVLSGAGYGVSWGLAKWSTVSTDNAYVQGELTPVAPEVSGEVLELAVTDNQFVEKGDLLLRIDPDRYAAKVDELRAALGEAEGQLTVLRTQASLQKTRISETRAALTAARAELSLAKTEFTRRDTLKAKGWSTTRAHDQAKTDVKVTNAHVAQAKSATAAAEDGLVVIEAQLRQAEQRVKQITAKLSLSQLDLDDTEVRAPISGFVGNRTIRQGQHVNATQRVMTLVPLSDVWVEANFKETQLTDLRVGDSVDVVVDTYPDAMLTGTVNSIAPASGAEFSLIPPDNATGNFTKIVQRIPVKITFAQGHPLEGILRPGMSAEVTFSPSRKH